jgi:hypothetical protein
VARNTPTRVAVRMLQFGTIHRRAVHRAGLEAVEKNKSLTPTGSFNTMQCRVVTCLLTGHNTLGRHLYIMGQTDNPVCWSCRADHVLCECEDLATNTHTHTHT